MGEEQKPSIGKIVHYQSYNEKGGCPYASIITQVNADGSVELAPEGVRFTHSPPYTQYIEN